MKTIRHFDGISDVLRKRGYSTTYFTTHDGQFDNIEGFLRANEFDNVISKDDYPSKEVKTTLGVPDDYMFEFSIPIINSMNAGNQPFFACFMTASDHEPYYLPEYFQPSSSKLKHKMVEYADWSLSKFIELSSKEEWFDNTIFVFIADHGDPLYAPYDISLDYHHTPLIFYAPNMFKESRTFSDMGSQIDVFPTIMGLIGTDYINNTLGIDLMSDKRLFVIVNDDDKVGVLNDSLFLIMKEGFDNQLYKYRNSNLTNYIDKYPTIAGEMEEHARSNMQVMQYMLLNEKILSLSPE